MIKTEIINPKKVMNNMLAHHLLTMHASLPGSTSNLYTGYDIWATVLMLLCFSFVYS